MLAAVAVLSLSVVLANAPSPAAGLLSPEEARQVLRAIDDLCGDTWCEGDNNFSFDALSCDAESGCRLELTVKPYPCDDEVLPPRPYTCVLPALTQREQIVQIAKDAAGQPRASYAEPLREALSSCISGEIEKVFATVLLPRTSGCHQALLQRPYHSYAAYSVQAEHFFETEDKRVFAARVARELVEQTAASNPACRLALRLAYLDEIHCERFGRTSTVCQLPSDSASLLVVKDYVDRAAVIFRPARHDDQTPALTLSAQPLEKAFLPDPAQCYDELFLRSAVSRGQYTTYPGPHGDHQTHYVRLPGPPAADIRLWALRHIQALVSAHARAGKDCTYQPQPFALDQADCRLLGGIPVCSFAADHGGYFIVTFDTLGASQVVFARWD